MTEIKFAPPDADAPGYLLRTRKALGFLTAMKEERAMSVELLDDMVDFLAGFVSEPKDAEEKRQALLMASENQFQELLALVVGESKKKLSGGTKSSPSDSTPGELL